MIKESNEYLKLDINNLNIKKMIYFLANSPYGIVYGVKNSKIDTIFSSGDLWRSLKTDNFVGNNSFVFGGSKEEAIKIIQSRPNIHSVPVIDNKRFICQIQEEYQISKEFINGVKYKLNNYNEIGVKNVFSRFNVEEIRLIITQDTDMNLMKEIISNLSVLHITYATYQDFIEHLGKDDESNLIWVDTGENYFCKKLRRYIWGEKTKGSRYYYIKDFLNLVNTCCKSYNGIEKYLLNVSNLYKKVTIYSRDLHYNSKNIENIIDDTDLEWNGRLECYELTGPEREIDIVINFELLQADNIPFYYNGKKIYTDNYYWNCESLLCNWIEDIYKNIFKPNHILLKLFECNSQKVIEKAGVSNISEFRGNDIGKQMIDSPEDAQNFLAYEAEENRMLFDEINGLAKNVVHMKALHGGTLDYSIERNPEQIEKQDAKNIHIFGCCLINGVFVKDQDTIASVLKKHYPECNVYSHGSLFVDLKETIQAYGKFGAGDIVLIMPTLTTSIELGYSDIEVIDISECFDNVENLYDCIWQVPLHCNHIIVKRVGEILAQKIKGEVTSCKDKNRGKVQLSGMELENELDNYLAKLKEIKFSGSNNGAIVMNCNPFTNGHNYLISEASQQVETLFIFVVEEDKSFFPFQDRFKLVKDNCADYENVIVLPSGKFIISALTMPGYFEKDYLQDEQLDASQDLDIFASKIAPILNIRTRFVGTEPIDKFTAQYNREMKERLPQWGIRVMEIERLMLDDKVVSASMIRKSIKAGNYSAIQQWVPKKTFDYLMEMKG